MTVAETIEDGARRLTIGGLYVLAVAFAAWPLWALWAPWWLHVLWVPWGLFAQAWLRGQRKHLTRYGLTVRERAVVWWWGRIKKNFRFKRRTRHLGDHGHICMAVAACHSRAAMYAARGDLERAKRWARDAKKFGERRSAIIPGAPWPPEETKNVCG